LNTIYLYVVTLQQHLIRPTWWVQLVEQELL